MIAAADHSNEHWYLLCEFCKVREYVRPCIRNKYIAPMPSAIGMITCLILASQHVGCRTQAHWCESFEPMHQGPHSTGMVVLRRLDWCLHLPSVWDFRCYWLRRCSGHGDGAESTLREICTGPVPLALSTDNRFHAAVAPLALQETGTPALLDSGFSTHGVSLIATSDLISSVRHFPQASMGPATRRMVWEPWHIRERKKNMPMALSRLVGLASRSRGNSCRSRRLRVPASRSSRAPRS